MSTVTAPDAPTLHTRLERQLNALLAISRRWRKYESHPVAAFKNITEAASAALAVDRVSVWMIDDDRQAIVCRDLYEFTKHRHTSGFKLARADHPAYFAALERDELVAATDAHTHPSTRGFSASYLAPHRIGAMLDVPIRVGGQLVGVLCHEHVGGPRLFLSDEQTTARLLGNLASLACEIEGRRRSEERAAWNYSLAEAAVESACIGVVATDPDGVITYANERVRAIWGMPQELLDWQRDSRVEYLSQLVRDPAGYQATISNFVKDRSSSFDSLRVELKDGRTLEIGSRPQIVDGSIIGRVWTVRELTGE